MTSDQKSDVYRMGKNHLPVKPKKILKSIALPTTFLNEHSSSLNTPTVVLDIPATSGMNIRPSAQVSYGCNICGSFPHGGVNGPAAG